MLFKVIMRISIPVGADGVTPEDRADGFTSEWAALPIAVPQARAILLATYGYPGDGQRTSPDGLHVDYISPETNGDFEIESGTCQLWVVRVEFQADWIHYRLRAHFRGLEEQKLLAFRTAKSQSRPITYVFEDILVKVKLCCDASMHPAADSLSQRSVTTFAEKHRYYEFTDQRPAAQSCGPIAMGDPNATQA